MLIELIKLWVIIKWLLLLFLFFVFECVIFIVSVRLFIGYYLVLRVNWYVFVFWGLVKFNNFIIVLLVCVIDIIWFELLNCVLVKMGVFGV